MNIQLSAHFNYAKLLKFVVPSIFMMVFSSIYGIIDGYFVSNYVGKTSFAAVNFILPYTILLGAVGYMLGTGGSTIISKTLGEKKRKEASECFTMFVIATIVIGILLTLIGLVTIRPLSVKLGATGRLLKDAVSYGKILLYALPVYMLQIVFQSFFITAGKPTLGLYVTIVSGLTNIVFDVIFIVVCSYGVEGAAIATAFSQVVGGIVPIFYFMSKNKSTLHFTKVVWKKHVFVHGSMNGISEFVTDASTSNIAMLYNSQLMKFENFSFSSCCHTNTSNVTWNYRDMASCCSC